MSTIERRHSAVELRVDGPARRLTGYAAVFGVEADIGGQFFETLRAGCFQSSLAGQDDIAALVDHESSRLIGRRSSGTLKLAEDARGLSFDISVPDTTVGRDLIELAKRGDLPGCSFGFTDAVDEWRDRQHRELRSVRLIEISIITGGTPAYPDTVVSPRHRQRGPQSARERRHFLAGL